VVDQIEECYRIIYDHIKSDEASILIRCFSPTILHHKTLESADNVYIEKASIIISDMVFGDNDVEIEYDMKFNYSYPLNVVSNLKSSKPQPIYLISKSFQLIDDEYNKNKTRILNLISNSLNRDNTNTDLQKFYNLINMNDSGSEEKRKRAITNYLWTELMLKIEKNELLREKFKDRIQFSLEQRRYMFGLPHQSTILSLEFSNKHTQNVGVQIIDVLCNMVWRYGPNAPKNASSAVRGIYKNILVDKG
jgi:hypothetical protein